MHAQAGRGVDLDDGAAGDVERLVDARGDHVDARHVQADHGGGVDGPLGHQRMDLVGDVDGAAARAEVRVPAQENDLSRSWDGVDRHALRGQHLAADLVQAQLGERRGVILAAPRILVLDLDQFGDGVLAIAGHGGADAPGRRNQAATDDQQAEVAALDVALDQHFVLLGAGEIVRGHHGLARAQRDGNAAPLVAPARLDDHGEADLLRGLPCLFRVLDGAAFGHRHADRGEQRLGQILVLRDRLGDGAGAIGLGGPDAARPRTVAEDDQAAVGEAAGRDAARLGRAHDGAGGRPQPDRLVQLAQLLGGGREIDALPGARRREQIEGEGQCAPADFLFLVLDEHAIRGAGNQLVHRGRGDVGAGRALERRRQLGDEARLAMVRFRGLALIPDGLGHGGQFSGHAATQVSEHGGRGQIGIHDEHDLEEGVV